MARKPTLAYSLLILSAAVLWSCILPQFLADRVASMGKTPPEIASPTTLWTATQTPTPTLSPSPTITPTVTATDLPTPTFTPTPIPMAGVQLETNAGIDFAHAVMNLVQKSYSEYAYLIITLSNGKLTDKDANELILENDSLIEVLEAIPLPGDDKEEANIQRDARRLLAKVSREYGYIDEHGVNASSWDRIVSNYLDTAEIFINVKNECMAYVTANSIPANENDAELALTGKLLISINPLEPGLNGPRVIWYDLELREETEIKKFYPRYLINNLVLSPDQEQIFVNLLVTDTAQFSFKYGLMSSTGENYRDIPVEVGSGFLGFTPDSRAILYSEVIEENDNGLSQEVKFLTWNIETHAEEIIDQLTIYHSEIIIAAHPSRDSIFFWTSNSNSENIEQKFLDNYKTRVIFGGSLGSVGTDFTLSDDGSISAVSYLKKEQSGIEIIELGESNNSLFTFSYQPIEGYDFSIRQGDEILAISPDNERILYSFASNLYLYNQGQQTHQALTSCPMKDEAPLFSPDGLFLVYRSFCYFSFDTIIVDLQTLTFEIIMDEPEFNESTHAWVP